MPLALGESVADVHTQHLTLTIYVKGVNIDF